ncbi:hypothetical protein ACWDZ4_28790 [Streptomyces sp. NPDC003016]
MADERYEWLDKGAAERLLRGEPVGPVGDHARAQAERLSAALDAVARAGGPESGELPGEAAALAAFRKARAASPEVFSTVRGGRRAPAPVRWGRPVRVGLAGALAGVALGGVAVAAGTGVLPGPFGRDADPAPASSAAATPHPASPGTADREPGAPGEPAPGATGTPGGADGTPGSGTGGAERDGDGESDGESGGTHDSSPGPDTGTPTTGPGSADADADADAGAPGTGDSSDPASRPGSGDWYRKTAKACQDYRTGDLAPDRERRLEAAAKGADRVERFCDRLLEGADGAAGGEVAGAGGTEGRDGDGVGEGRGDGGSGGDTNGGTGGDTNGGTGGSSGTGGRSVDGGQGVRDGIRRSVPQVSFTRPASPALASSVTAAFSSELL